MEESGPEAQSGEERGASLHSQCSETGLYADIFPNPALSVLRFNQLKMMHEESEDNVHDCILQFYLDVVIDIYGEVCIYE